MSKLCGFCSAFRSHIPTCTLTCQRASLLGDTDAVAGGQLLGGRQPIFFRGTLGVELRWGSSPLADGWFIN
jgi:hypothetical protein